MTTTGNNINIMASTSLFLGLQYYKEENAGSFFGRDEEIDKLKVGDFIFHINYGKGEIRTIKKMAKDKISEIHFESGSKILVLVTSGFFRKINT